MANTRSDRHTDQRDAARTLALAIGVVYFAVGVAGFFVTGFDDFADKTGDKLLGFELNPLHNIVHLVIGAAGIALSRTRESAITFGWLLFVGYGATFVYGLFVANGDDGNFLSINSADNVLHIVSALAGLAIVALAARKPVAGRRAQPHGA